MIFAAGYQPIEVGELFSEMIRDYRDDVREVYFSYPGFASGRPENMGNIPEQIEQLEFELQQIRKMGMALDLLFNGNCYGQWAISSRFQREIVAAMERLASLELLPEIITTTSPFVASVIRKYFPGTEVRASVNMKIDSLEAMEFLADKFDSFYIRRDLQRDLPTVEKFHLWCRQNGKKLCMLANSGCLINCPYQTFHDNLVAHDAEVREVHNVSDFMPHLCWERYRNKANRDDFLKGSWICPEDVDKYAGLIDVMKLATRQHASPRMVIAAYTRRSFSGNLYDLTEPCFASLFAPDTLQMKSRV